jgi:predicted amidohydrolase
MLRSGLVDTQVLLGQIPVTFSVEKNMEAIAALLDEADRGDIVITPEGALSGYPARGAGELELLLQVDQDDVRRNLDVLADMVHRAGVYLWVGTCLREGAQWLNTAIGMAFNGTFQVYRKVNLSPVEQGTFTPGNWLPVFPMGLQLANVTVGVQLCREVRFSEQWIHLAERGAQVFAHLNNAVGPPDAFEVWRSQIISRAAETQRFVASVNAAAPDQLAPTMVVAPTGEVLGELPPGGVATLRAELDLGQISNRHLSERRTDLYR